MKAYLLRTTLIALCLLTISISGTALGAKQLTAMSSQVHLPLLYFNYPHIPDQIAFRLTNPENYGENDIFLVNDDGTQLTDLTNMAWMSNIPIWSPDGASIAFSASVPNDDSEIYVVTADGSTLYQLTDDSYSDSSPSWSPDSSQIVYTSYRDDKFSIYVLNVDGSGEVLLANISQETRFPQWSPDGSKIAFTTSSIPYNLYNNTMEISVVNADGSGLTQLTENDYYDSVPIWFPDSTKFLFFSNRDMDGMLFRSDLFSMTPAGTEIVKYSSGGVTHEASPSPDSSRIAYSDGTNLNVVNSDGPGTYPLLCDGTEPINPNSLAWSPDGARIAFIPETCGVGGNYEDCGLYMLDLDGMDCTLLLNIRIAYGPAWRPKPTNP